MQTAYPNGAAGGAYLPTSQDSSVPPLPAVYLPNEMQISIVAAQPSRQLGVPYDAARSEGFARSQNFQDSRNFGISVNANSIRQVADNSGQQRDSWKLYFSERLPNSLELSNDIGLSCQLSTHNIVEFHTDQEICDYVKERLAYLRKNINRGPCLSNKRCPNDNDSPLQSHCNPSRSSSEDCQPTSSTCDKEDVEQQSLSCAAVDHFTTTTTKAPEEYSSKASEANAELTPKSKEKSETSASDRISTGTLFSDVENAKHADFDLQVRKHLDVNNDGKRVCSDDCEDETFARSSDENFHNKWYNKYTLNGITTLQYSLTALKELIASLENVKTIAKTENFSEVILQQFWNGNIDNLHMFASTEYPQIINEAAATCTKTEEESPVVLTAMSGVTLRFPGWTLGCSSSQQESKSVLVNADNDGRVLLRHKDRGDKGLKPVELDNVEGRIKDSKDSWRVIEDEGTNIHKQKTTGNQQHCPVSSKEAAAHSNPSIDRILINNAVPTSQNKQPVYNQTSCKNTGKDVSYVCNRNAECSPLKEPQYEDISDIEDMSEHEEVHLPLRLEDLQYEDISEDENPPMQSIDVEMPSCPLDVSEPNVKPYEHVQSQIKSVLDEEQIQVKHSKTEILGPHFGEPDAALCSRPPEWQTNRSCSPSSDLKDDDETDDDWIIIPLLISDIKLELPEDDPDPVDVLSDVGEHTDDLTLSEIHQLPPVQVPASAFSQIEVFDTCESFQKAKAVQFGKFPQNLSAESLPKKGPKSRHSRNDSSSESEDSCETDDSCDYSPVEQRNHLTVSMKLLNNLPASSSSETNDSESEKDHPDDEATNLQNKPTRSTENTYKKDDIIILNSDTEDECDSGFTNNARRQKRFFLQNEVSAADAYSPQKRCSSETVAKENLLERELLPSHSVKMTANSEQLCENIALSEHVQQDVSDDDSIIVIDSDKEEDSIQNHKAKRKRNSSSECEITDNDPLVKQQRTPVYAEYETAKGKLEGCRQSADLSKPQHDSKHRETHSQQEMQDSCSDRPHSAKRGRLSEAGHVQQKTNRQMTSKCWREFDHVVTTDKSVKRKAKTKRRMLPSEPEGSDSASNVNNKSQESRSSEDQIQSGTDGEFDPIVGCNPVIPRLLIHNFPQDNRPLKLYKRPTASRQDTDETPKKRTSTSKTVDFSKTKTQLLHGDAPEKFVSNPKPAERHHVLSSSKPKESFSPPRKMSPLFKVQQPESSSSSIHSYNPAKGQSAITQVTNRWRESYYSTRKDKKNNVVMEESSRPKISSDLLKEAKPGRSQCDRVPRRRNSSQDSATPLMKKTMVEARELTKARNRDASCEQRHRVGEGYKWRK